VLVLDKRSIGDGASGGFLGALMPHMPDNWNVKKQMQFDALSSMAQAVAELEDDTGLDCGYRRCGRLMPLTHEKMPDNAKRRIQGAKQNWVDRNGTQIYEMSYLPPDFRETIAEGWLNEAIAPFGATFETLSARINPRTYLNALATYVRSGEHGLGQIRTGVELTSFKEEQNSVSVFLKSGETLSAERLVIANGWEAYDLLRGAEAKVCNQLITGRGVKGQALLLDFEHSDDRPILYDNGSYVVPHANNKIAVGSTSVNDWMPLGLGVGDEEWATESFAGDVVRGDPMAEKLIEASIGSFDHQDMGFYDYAMELCPSLRGATISERWANIRPRNTVRDMKTGKIGTEPILGPLDGSKCVEVKVGGFKISLGIGHSL
jgi:glycine/D-amino acid oxidase-like deaminating enzyme